MLAAPKRLMYVAAVMFAVFSTTASGATVLSVGNGAGDDVSVQSGLGSVQYDFGEVGNNDFSFDTSINLTSAPETQLEGNVFGDGSLSVAFYVDPYIKAGRGTANLLLGSTGTLPIGANLFAQWGGGPIVDLSDGMYKSIAVAFSGAGASFAENLVFTWSGLGNVKSYQLSAAVAPVPVPAAGLLLIGALAGLVALRRRQTVS